MSAQDPVLAVEGLTKSFTLYARNRRVPVLDGLSFTVRASEVVVFVGPSGAGKSTVLKSIWRTDRPEGGRILYAAADGRRVDLARVPETEILRLRASELAFVTQFLHALPRSSAVELVARPLRRQGVDRETARERAIAALSAAGLPRHLHELPPATFSGGERQRVNLARAFAGAPRLLLLDEPTASLDPEARDRVFALIDRARLAGTAILAILHDREAIDRLADRIVEVRPLQELPCA